MGRKGKATQPSCDERNQRGRANAKQAKMLALI